MEILLIHSKKPCIVCASKSFVNFYCNQSEFELINGEKIIFDQSLECCYTCGLVRQQENATYSDTNLDKYYAGTYRTPLQLELLDKSDLRKANARQRLKFVTSLKKSGTLMEAGFGDGVFLNEARKTFACTGIDPSKGYSNIHDYLSKNGVTVFNGPLQKFPAKNKFDVVCSFLVLEHIKNPLPFLAQMKKHLKPGGLLVIELPDIRRYKLFNSETMLTHEHVYHYNIETLSALLAQAGMKRVGYSNRDISYGFSLIAAFKAQKKAPQKLLTNGFETLEIFEEFLDMRERYRLKMKEVLEQTIKRAHNDNHTVAVYGTGFLFNFAQRQCGLKVADLDYLLDDTKERVGKSIEGKQILSTGQISQKRLDVVIVFSEVFFELMKNKLVQHSSANPDMRIIDIHQQSL